MSEFSRQISDNDVQPLDLLIKLSAQVVSEVRASLEDSRCQLIASESTYPRIYSLATLSHQCVFLDELCKLAGPILHPIFLHSWPDITSRRGLPGYTLLSRARMRLPSFAVRQIVRGWQCRTTLGRCIVRDTSPISTHLSSTMTAEYAYPLIH